MTNENKEFIKLMLTKSKEKTKSRLKAPFENVDIAKVETLTKEIIERKRRR
jgi:hypothetical protein